MKIGIDIDGVLTNEDDYILACTSKYCYENDLNSFSNPNAFEFDKLNWNEETINNYRDKYFYEYIEI